MSRSEWTLTSNSPEETVALGRRIGQVAELGLVIALCGNLGAGKTRFVQGFADGIGLDPSEVRSPTFTLIHEYEGRLPVYHLDVYRLTSVDEYLDLGADELAAASGVMLIEWADRVASVLPSDQMTVRIDHQGESIRTIHLQATGPISRRVLSKINPG